MRSLRFRRVPFGRDGAFDPGGATASCIAMPHILPSTVPSVSASATLFLSWLNPPLHPITVYASHPSSPTTAQHSLPGGALPSYRGRFFSPAGTHQRTGTEIPNPLPSSGESANLRFLRSCALICDHSRPAPSTDLSELGQGRREPGAGQRSLGLSAACSRVYSGSVVPSLRRRC